MNEEDMSEQAMSEQEEKNLADLLKQSIAPVNRELDRDLWPQVLRRLDQRSADPTWFARTWFAQTWLARTWLASMFSAHALSSVPWFDWALLAALVVGVCVFPNSIPVWLYHF